MHRSKVADERQAMTAPRQAAEQGEGTLVETASDPFFDREGKLAAQHAPFFRSKLRGLVDRMDQTAEELEIERVVPKRAQPRPAVQPGVQLLADRIGILSFAQTGFRERLRNDRFGLTQLSAGGQTVDRSAHVPESSVQKHRLLTCEHRTQAALDHVQRKHCRTGRQCFEQALRGGHQVESTGSAPRDACLDFVQALPEHLRGLAEIDVTDLRLQRFVATELDDELAAFFGQHSAESCAFTVEKIGLAAGQGVGFEQTGRFLVVRGGR
ncbi:hypothetical protein HFP89_14390 [Wenzhouxiangella sp. XN79A]|uniref:hypothetical protein n=1 Tax=Wenzhouxiangella sp. XN79A TaxID=2724193 RepID=UPI00144AB500|nr:hypothetical protein [Wenzhouxiangella sp. XN79A]NKI36356.1 hypothetical protein [Wenzhouxiangella sp. XN79A]